MNIKKNWKTPCEKWLEEIRNEVYYATRINIIGHNINTIANSNPDLSKNSELWNWIENSFTCQIIIKLSKILEPFRQNDKRAEDDITFEEFLETLKNNPSDIMTKEKYAEKNITGTDYYNQKQRQERLDKYSELTGDEEPKEYIPKDILKLKEKREKYKDYRNDYIAHMKIKKEDSHIPIFTEVGETIELLQELVIKYSNLIEGGDKFSYKTFNKMPEYGNVFDIPWKKQVR